MDISMLKTPDPLTRGSAPETRWGFYPLTPPRYRLAHRARHVSPAHGAVAGFTP